MFSSNPFQLLLLPTTGWEELRLTFKA